MNADEAAELTAILKPELAVPHHYAFTKGFLGDRLITRSDKNPLRFQDATRDLAPETSVRIVNPGTRIEL
jgi:L-ascorbate metabolism protein UlaG (beta-lactamase superfamily)